MTTIPHFINGQRTTGQSTRTADVLNPSTGAAQAQVALASAADVDAAVAGAVAAQQVWAAWNPQRRARVLMKFIELVNQNKDELARLLSLEHGKTFDDSLGDIQRGVEVIEFAVGIPHLMKGEFTESAGTGIDVFSIRQPLGVVAGITPFNFPAMIPLWKAGPALACGNALIIKPSERDPSVPLRFAELFIEAGLPEGVLQIVNGDKDIVEGKNQNHLSDANVAKLAGAVQSFKDQDRFCKVVALAELHENDHNLNITRYVQTEAAPDTIDVTEEVTRLEELIEKRDEAEGKMLGFLKELGYAR